MASDKCSGSCPHGSVTPMTDLATGLPTSMSSSDSWQVIVISPWGEAAGFRDRGTAQIDRVFTTLGKPDVPWTNAEGQRLGGEPGE